MEEEPSDHEESIDDEDDDDDDDDDDEEEEHENDELAEYLKGHDEYGEEGSSADEEGEEEDDDEEFWENFDLAAYMEQDHSSFRCFKEIFMSSSSLMRNALFNFPTLKDPGLDKAFDYVEPEVQPDDVGIEIYKQRCKEYNIVPLSIIIKSLRSPVLNLKYYSISSKQVRAVMEALRRNRYVEHLILEENFLNSNDLDYLNEMLLVNGTIKKLNMRNCQIGAVGAMKLVDCIEGTPITDLDLSFNSIGNEGMKPLSDALCTNQSVARLNLSKNELGEVACVHLANLFENNDIIEDLDLSWNEIYTPQATKILFKGLTENKKIKSLNLSWNGFGLIKESALPIVRYLKNTEMMERLDLSNNRLLDASLKSIRAGIAASKSLKYVNLSYNIIKPEEATPIAQILTRKDKLLEQIDLNCFVKPSFKQTKARIENLGKTVVIEGYLGDYAVHGPDEKKLLFERIKYLGQKAKKKKKRVDFGQFQFSLPDKSVTKDEFAKLLKKGKLRKVVKDKDLFSYIGTTFPDKNDIDCVEIKRKYMELYPDTEPPPPKKKKKKKKKGKKGKKKSKKDDEPKGEIEMPAKGQPKEVSESKTEEAKEGAEKGAEEKDFEPSKRQYRRRRSRSISHETSERTQTLESEYEGEEEMERIIGAEEEMLYEEDHEEYEGDEEIYGEEGGDEEGESEVEEEEVESQANLRDLLVGKSVLFADPDIPAVDELLD